MWIDYLSFFDATSLENKIKQNWKQTKFDEILFHLTSNCNTGRVIAVCGCWQCSIGWTLNMFHAVKLEAIEEYEIGHISFELIYR